MKKIVLLIGVIFFVAGHSFAGDMVEEVSGDLKARQGQFADELDELRDQEIKVVKKINESIDKYSKTQDLKILQQVIDGKSRLINVLQKEQDVSRSYIDDLEKKLSNITNGEFTPLEKREGEFKSPLSHKI